MHVMNATRAGALVQVVYILSAEIEIVFELFFNRRERTMGYIRFRSESVAPAHGVKIPYQRGVRLPGLGSSNLLDAVPIPKSA